MNSNTPSVRPPEPLTQTGQALTDGELSPAHAAVLAHGIQGGVRPQLTVTVDLDSLVGHSGHGALGGETDSGPWIPRRVGG
jgi:hypothetical protein